MPRQPVVVKTLSQSLDLEDIPGEIWQPIIGHRGYEISDLGRVRRDGVTVATINRRTGPILRVVRKRILKQAFSQGYTQVVLNQRTRRVHRLVLERFVGPCPTGFNCNHKNGVRSDNRLENLEWCSVIDNIHHAIATGLTNRGGESDPCSKLRYEDVVEIRRLFLAGESKKDIGKIFDVSASTVAASITQKTWCLDNQPSESDLIIRAVLTNRGERNPKAKLTEEDVRRIRSAHVEGRGLSDLGREYNITPQAIWQIVERRSWKHIE